MAETLEALVGMGEWELLEALTDTLQGPYGYSVSSFERYEKLYAALQEKQDGAYSLIVIEGVWTDREGRYAATVVRDYLSEHGHQTQLVAIGGVPEIIQNLREQSIVCLGMNFNRNDLAEAIQGGYTPAQMEYNMDTSD
jgi:hypothetical protein